jgi:hypothetical protein
VSNLSRVLLASEDPASCDVGKREISGWDESQEFIAYLLGCVFGMHPLRVVAVLPERAGAAVRTVGKTTVDAVHWVGAGVT